MRGLGKPPWFLAFAVWIPGFAQGLSWEVVAAHGVGDGESALSAPIGAARAIALNGSGKLYVADTRHARIRVVENGVISTVAGTGATGYDGDGVPGGSAGSLPDGRAAAGSPHQRLARRRAADPRNRVLSSHLRIPRLARPRAPHDAAAHLPDQCEVLAGDDCHSKGADGNAAERLWLSASRVTRSRQ